MSVSAAKGKTIMSTSWGAPIDDDNNSLTIGPYGPILLQDFHLLDKIGHFDFERIPERVVHAKGAGAHGYFEVTHDVTMYTKAAFLNKVGKRTPVFMRFSPVTPERGSSDVARDPRGFAIKHYTEEGNYDMVGNNTPIFFIRDPIQFPDLVHSQKRNPQSFLKDANAYWDFAVRVPESIHQMMFNFSDRGIPATYRHMNGYSSNTYKWVNAKGEGFWVKLHYKTEVGIKNLSDAGAGDTQGKDPDHATRDLFNHLKAGKVAAWRAFVQVMPEDDWTKYKWNVFDVTKVWAHKDYPLIPYGRLVLDRNPTNYFAETEQVAFCVNHFVPGIEPSPDRILQGRLFSYQDTNRARLGPNFMQIPINCPYKSIYKGGAPDLGATGEATQDKSATAMRHYHDACQNNNLNDGKMVVNDNGGNRPNYNPASDALAPQADKQFAIKRFHLHETVGRIPQPSELDFEQPNQFWNKVLDDGGRQRLVLNIANHVAGALDKTQQGVIELCGKVDPEFGKMLAKRLKDIKKDDGGKPQESKSEFDTESPGQVGKEVEALLKGISLASVATDVAAAGASDGMGVLREKKERAND